MKLHLPLSLLIYLSAVSFFHTAEGDTGSAWDANWGAAGLAGAPDAAAAQYQSELNTAGVTALVQPEGVAAPYDFGTYTAITLVGTGNAGAQVFGGASATDSAATGAIALDTWISAEAGQYQMLVGGNYADNWQSGAAFNFTGNTHILVNGASVATIVGGNFKDGQSASFTGDSYISVMRGNVSGAIVGAGVVAHNRNVQFSGDTHVFVYVPLSDNSGPTVNLLPVNMVMGGFGWATNTWKTQTVTGDTHVTVDLSAYEGASSSFAKHVVGGGFSGASGNSQVINGNTFVSVDLGDQTMADNTRVVGGHWVNAGTGTVTGTAHLSIGGGSFQDWVVGGCWTDVAGTSTSCGGVSIHLNGGTVNGHVTAASYLAAGQVNATVGSVQAELAGTTINGTLYGGYYIAGTGSDNINVQLGDVQLMMQGGEVNNIVGGTSVARNRADAAVQQGGVNIDLRSGTVNGYVYAAGQQLGTTPILTESTTVTIGTGVAFADSSVVSGGYAGSELSSTVQSDRTLIFDEAATYTNTATVSFESFDVVQVAEGASVSIESLSKVPALHKTGAGDLTLTSDDSLRSLTIEGGSLNLASGQPAPALQQLTMAAGTQLSGLSGTLSSADTGLNLTFSPQNVGDSAAGTPMLQGNGLVVDISSAANVVLDLSADVVVDLLSAHRDAGVVSWLTLTDGTLQFADAAADAILPELSAYGVRVSGVSGGSLLLSGQAQGVYYVTSDSGTTDPHWVSTYPTLGMYEGVVIEDGETLTLSLPGSADDAESALVRNLTGGVNSTLLLQNSTGQDTVRVALEQQLDTVMGGHIVAQYGTRLIKQGSGSLTVQGGVQAGELQVAVGDLVLEGSGNVLGTIYGEGSLTLGAASVTQWYFNADAREQVIDLAQLVIAAGASLTLEAVGTEFLLPGEYVLGELDTLSAGDYQLTLSGTPFFRIDTEHSFLLQEDGRLSIILVEPGSNPLADVATSYNAGAGAQLLWNTEHSAGGESESLFQHVMQLLRHGDEADAEKLLAAAAGASYASLGSALRQDVQQRLYAIRNRTSQMGLSECYVYDDIPYLNAWVSADAAYADLAAAGTAPGYTLSSWGGTLGVDMSWNTTWTTGMALTALYGDFDARAADSLSGDVDRYYLSLFARYDQCGWSHSLIASAMLADLQMQRRVLYSGGGYATESNGHGYGLGLMYELAYKWYLDEQKSAYLEPLVNVMYTYSALHAFTEQGADTALHVGGSSQNDLVFGMGVRGLCSLVTTEDERTATLHGYAMLNLHAGERRNKTSVAWADASASAAVISARDSILGAEIGAGLSIPIGSGSGVLFMDAATEFRAHRTDFSGSIGYSFRF